MSLTPNEKDLLAKKSDLEGILKPDANDILHLPDITISLAENQQGYSTSTLSKDGLTLGSGGTITGITSSSGNSTSLAASQSMVSAKQDKIIAGSNITIAQDGKTISATDTNELENLTDVNITTPTGGQGLVYNNTTQKWENGNVSSASSIDTLTDVHLTNLTDGQVLKYDSTNQEWINANGGGGSTVIPNPTGTPTDTLDTVSIDGTIYEIQGGGGGGSAKQDILYVAPTMSETQISIDFTEYDEYIIYANDVLITQQIPQGVSFPKTVIEKAIADSSNISIYGYSSAACAYTVTSNSLTKISSAGDYTITMIVGVRGGSSSESYSTTEHKIGTWVDGSDLYEKTINLTGTYSADGAIDISSYLAGNENIIESVGYLSYVYEGSTYKLPINGSSVYLEYRVDKYQLRLLLGSGSINMDAYITIKYTKVSS